MQNKREGEIERQNQLEKMQFNKCLFVVFPLELIVKNLDRLMRDVMCDLLCWNLLVLGIHFVGSFVEVLRGDFVELGTL